MVSPVVTEERDMANNNRRKTARSIPPPKRNQRFQQLLALAREGNEDAVGDLWREFHFDFAREGGRHDAD